MIKKSKRDEARHGRASDPIVAGGPVFDELVPRKITKGSKQELRKKLDCNGRKPLSGGSKSGEEA